MTSQGDGDRTTSALRGLLLGIFRQTNVVGVEDLMDQAATVEIVGGPVTMLDLRVARTRPAPLKSGPLPIRSMVLDASGTEVGEVIVWIDNGYIDTLELAWWSEEPPAQLPVPDRIHVVGSG